MVELRTGHCRATQGPRAQTPLTPGWCNQEISPTSRKKGITNSSNAFLRCALVSLAAVASLFLAGPKPSFFANFVASSSVFIRQFLALSIEHDMGADRRRASNLRSRRAENER